MPRAGLIHCTTIDRRSDQMYIIGGWDSNSGLMSPDTHVFDMAARTFSTMQGQMSVGRVSHACTLLEEEDVIIAAGGNKQGWGSTSTVEILDLIVGTWSNAKSLPVFGRTWAVEQNVFTWTPTELFQYDVAVNEWVELENAPFDLSLMQGYFLPLYAGPGVDDICSFV